MSQAGGGSFRILLWIVAVGFFMQTLDSTIVNTALPSMARALGESPLSMHAVIIAYALTMAMLIPASGWLADRFGSRNVFLAAIVLFTVGSVACAASTSLTQLVLSRIVQGAGGAMLLPVGRLVVLRNVPRDQFLAAMSFVAIPGLIGPLVGPTLGGWLVQTASWHWIFLINLPVGLVGVVLTVLYMPESRNPGVGRFDTIGYLMLSLGMVALSFSLDGLTDFGFERATVLVLLVFAFALIVGYFLHAQRHPAPLFPLSLFRIHTYTVGLLGNLFARIGSGAMPFLIPLLLQVGLARSPLEAGMMMLPVAAMAMTAKRAVTRLINRYGYRRFLVVNTLALGCLQAAFAFMPLLSLPAMLILLGCYGAVNSFQFTAMNTVTLRDLDPAGAGSGNSLFSMVQMLSMSLGVTVAGALLATFTTHFAAGIAGSAVTAFQATFVTIGLLTSASAWIFWHLDSGVSGGGRGVPADEAG